MPETQTNNLGLVVGEEPSLGADPTTWTRIEPNELTTFGPEIATVERDPISPDRQERAGTITDLDSPVELAADVIMSHFILFQPYFMRSVWVNRYVNFPSVVSATSYTVPAGDVLPAGTLIRATGFGVAGNNGENKVVDAGATATDVPIVGGLTIEVSPPAGAQIEREGVRSAAGDLGVDASGNITSTVLDFTTLPIQEGQAIHVGGQAALNRFTDADNFGFARVVAIATNLLTLDKKATVFALEAGASQEVDLLFSGFLRNVPVDDSDYNNASLQIEAAWKDLETGPADGYEYSKGNKASSMAIEVPGQDKATFTLSLVGTDTDPPTTVRKTGADTPTELLKTEAMNTTSDIARLRVTELDETGLTTDFTSLTITLDNQSTAEKVLGFLGARNINDGNFRVTLETEVLFSSSAVLSAVRENRTVTMDFALRNSDGGFFIDFASLKLGGGARVLNRNETAKVTLTGRAFKDATLGYTLGISAFAFLPTV